MRRRVASGFVQMVTSGSSTRVVAYDTETALIRPALMAPPLVVVTWQRNTDAQPSIAHHTTAEPVVRSWLEDPTLRIVGQNIAFDMGVLIERYPSLRKLVFKAYAEDRVTDTQIRQWLLDNAGGMYRGRVGERGAWISYNYGLEDLAKRVGMQLQKDAWRLSYGEFIDTPLKDWPERAVEVQAAARLRIPEREALLARFAATPKKRRGKGADAAVTALTKEIEGLKSMVASDPRRCFDYALEDAVATLKVCQVQEAHALYLKDQFRQARAYFALHLQSAWGLRTDEHGVEVLRKKTQEERDELFEDLVEAGLVRKDGSRDTKAAAARMLAVCKESNGVIPLLRTDAHKKCPSACECGDPKCKHVGKKKGHREDFSRADFCKEHICLDKDACEGSEDDILADYSAFTTLNKVLSNDIVALAGGIMYPVHTRYGFAATGRTTSSKPNIQNQSNRAGVREAFIPRPGKVFIGCDYPQLELYTLAQCCVSWFGESELARILIAGQDPHLAFAAKILRLSYDNALNAWKNPNDPLHKIVKKTRKQAKPGNFGFPGGMGAPKFLTATRKQMGRVPFKELDMDLPRVHLLKEQWFQALPEMVRYFARVNQLTKTDSGRATVETLFTERTRGNATYCATSNNGFQALGSDCAKEGVWRIARACYDDESDPLFGSRAVAFVHDENIAEAPAPANDNDWRASNAAESLGRHMADGANVYLKDVPIPYDKMKPVMMLRWSKDAEQVRDDKGRIIPWVPEAKAAA